MQGKLKRWDWLTGDRPTTWFLKETCSHAPWDCRVATQANGGSICEPKRPCQTCTNNILPASWLCPGFRVCVGGLQGQFLATRETAKLRGSILGLQPKRPGLGKIQGTSCSAFDSSACESVFWLKPTSTPHVQPSPGPVSAQQENSGRSQSPDCLITSVLTSWVSLLYVSHALSILFTLFSPSAAHISFSPACSLFCPPIPHHGICKWNVNYTDFISGPRDCRFSYRPVREFIHADQKQIIKSFLQFFLSFLLFPKI